MKTTFGLGVLILSPLLFFSGCAVPGGGNDTGGGATGVPTVAPSAPTDLIISNIDSSSVLLAWTDTSSNESGFKIDRFSYMSGSNTTIDVPAANTTSYTDTGLIVYSYRYTVKAYNGAGSSPASNGVTVNVGDPVAAPTGLTATATGSRSISLAWTQISSSVYYFAIERSSTSDSSGFAQIATTTSNPYTDDTCAAVTQYWYRISQTSSQSVTSAYSNVASATTTAGVSAPSGLGVVAAGSSLVLSWTASATTAVTYTVKRRQMGYSYAGTIATGISAATYTDTSASVGNVYFYSVAAALGSETSAYTGESSGGAALVHSETENNGPLSWASDEDWYYGGDGACGSADLFEVKGTYSGSYAIYNPASYKNYDYDVFKISLSKGNSIRFSKNSGTGMSVAVFWLESTDILSGHYFAAGGETYTPLINAGTTIKHAYIMVSLPSGLSSPSYDFTFSITR